MTIENSDDEKVKKKGRKRLAISGGLATIATIHAGHTVYQSVEKRRARKSAVREGTISKEEAQKHKTRDRLQDAASVGLAALGIKGAYSEWKEMKESMHEQKEQEAARKRHSRKREARKKKMNMVGMSDVQYSNSAPTLGEHYHGPDGPYMSGANGAPPSTMHYYDDNPYGWMGHQQDTGFNDGAGGGFYGGPGGNPSYSTPPPPAAGGTGFPPPPGSHPPQGK